MGGPLAPVLLPFGRKFGTQPTWNEKHKCLVPNQWGMKPIEVSNFVNANEALGRN